MSFFNSFFAVLLAVTWFLGCGVHAAVGVGTPATGTIGQGYFGLHVHSPTGTGSITNPVIPFGGLRLWDDQVSWAQINTSRGVYNWTTLDKYMALAKSHNVPVLYEFGKTPEWASANPSIPACQPGQNNSTCCNGNAGACVQPKYWSDLDNFVTALVTRYKGQIWAYELWNEPHNLYYWQGGMPNFVTLTKHIYDKIRAIDPGAIIISPSGMPAFMDKYWAAGGLQGYDRISNHVYSGLTLKPEVVVNEYKNMKAVAAKYAGLSGKLMMTTEGSWGQHAPGDTGAFVARWAFLHRAVGATRFFWYQYDGMAALASGTTILASGKAFETAEKWMIGATMPMAGCSYNGTDPLNAVYTCVLTRSNGYQALAVWNTNGSSKYAQPSIYKQYRTLSGSLVKITGGSVPIGVEPILIENMNAP